MRFFSRACAQGVIFLSDKDHKIFENKKKTIPAILPTGRFFHDYA